MGRQKDSLTDRFDRKVLETIRKFHLILPGQKVLVALSGGADSVSLLTVLKDLAAGLGISLCAVHVEHGIRGEESEGDAHFAEMLCQKYGIPLTVRHIRAVELSKESGRTLEEEARIQRYRIFREVAEAEGADAVAVAHNRNDQAETVLFNLIRGSGIRGLAGIRPSRTLQKEAAVPGTGGADAEKVPGTGGADAEKVPGTIRVIRPLLEVSRSEIEAYLKEMGVSFRTDRTNFDREISRNRIRLDVLPELSELNRQAAEHIAEAAEAAFEAEDYLERETEKALGRCVYGDSLILGNFFAEDPVIRKRVLRECVKRAMPGGSLKDIGQVHIEGLMQLAGKETGKSVSLPKGAAAVRENGVIRFLDRCQERNVPGTVEDRSVPGTGSGTVEDRNVPGTGSGNDEERNVPGTSEYVTVGLPFEGEKTVHAFGMTFRLSCGQAGPGPVEVPEKLFTKRIAYDTIAGNKKGSVCFRTRRPGDYLVVNKEGGRKKISDYLIDRKVPRRLRDQVVLLAAGSHVLWVVGGRISEQAKVTAGAHFLKIEKLEEEHERESDGTDSGRES